MIDCAQDKCAECGADLRPAGTTYRVINWYCSEDCRDIARARRDLLRLLWKE